MGGGRVVRWRVAVTGVLLAGGLLVWIVAWISAMRSPPEALAGTDVASVAVPGSDVVPLAAGRHTVYVDGSDRASDRAVATVTVRPANGEPALEVSPTGSSHDTVFGIGIATFDVRSAGDHTVEASGHPAVATVARGPLFDPDRGRNFVPFLVGGPAVFLVCMFAAVAVHPPAHER